MLGSNSLAASTASAQQSSASPKPAPRRSVQPGQGSFLWSLVLVGFFLLDLGPSVTSVTLVDEFFPLQSIVGNFFALLTNCDHVILRWTLNVVFFFLVSACQTLAVHGFFFLTEYQHLPVIPFKNEHTCSLSVVEWTCSVAGGLGAAAQRLKIARSVVCLLMCNCCGIVIWGL